ncbi:PEP/pyruvate-binding domain-containing protein [Desulfobacula toluolica]|uniref:Phosphoenolpyruvate synthase n=1 Tax=Desulfobacula toluolica (strain DSM 7467 / Tol2) TaxID=651182 RepID=K0N6Z6_DESTT|nr:PEP/pyruvate-binding domain-containing protein [Desulfobacula toluolica]CCK79759.1 PpsB: phenylphosphate synthase, beta subunit [Desulfobacula toluolica Tol2]
MEKRSDYVRWFEECDLELIPVVGGKNASLGELLKAKIPVPPGFAITTKAYKLFLEQGKIKQKIFKIIDGIKADDVDSGETASKTIRDLIEKTPVSDDLQDYICEFYRLLSKKSNVPAVPAAVRSSATAEDLPGASFAGQQDTFLWIRGADDILKHVKKCWSSLFTSRAIYYRTKMGFPHEQVEISVGVQKMANAWTAGVMFTLNPATGDRSTVAIDANWGFGESVVSGECTPDNFIINKITDEVIKKSISHKTIAYTRDPKTHCVVKTNVPVERADMQCVVDKDAVSLAIIGKRIEKHYGKAMDIEWAIDKDTPGKAKILILQSRPETVWSDKKAKPVMKTRSSALEHICAGLVAGRKVN